MRHKCQACKKKFRTEGALAMHARDKHPERDAPIIRQPKSGMLGLMGAFVAGICVGVLAMASQELGVGISQANDMVKAAWSR
jgi:predicted lipid-binding transport protein (Tim44 family)